MGEDRRKQHLAIVRDRRSCPDRRSAREPVAIERRNPTFTQGAWWEVKIRQWLAASVVIGRRYRIMPRFLSEYITSRYLYRWRCSP